MKKRRLPLDGAQLGQLVGIVAAMAVVVLLNVLAARRFTRWDATANKRYTLSTATIQTLHDLPQTTEIWVLLGSADPLEQGVKQLLVAYQAETTKLEIHYVDPERDLLALEDVKKRFKIETGRTDDGHVAADAVVVVARGERHWFVTSGEMIEPSSTDDTRVKPREERALTGALRNVSAAAKTKVCFTTGHGEASPLDPSDHGAGALKDVLEKDNYDVATVDLAALDHPKPLAGCGVAIVAGVRGAFTKDEAERLRTWALEEGNLLVAAGPIFGDDPAAPLVPAGLARVLGPFGIALEEDVVAEQDPELVFPEEQGIRFVATPVAHPITTALLRGPRSTNVPRIVLQRTRSVRRIEEPGAASASPLLATSDKAYGLRSIEGAARWKEAPQQRPGDLPGPLLLALAAERPKGSASAAHGPRVVVIGTESPLASASFRDPLPERGAALFAESAVAWLAAQPQVLDVPEKTAVGAGIRIDQGSRDSIRRYVVLFMPATVALLGIAIAVFRRAGEGKPRTAAKPTTRRKRRRPEDEP
ncbi:MAG: Mucin 2 precursor [Labilithrix sp.]|nr:Mucin 2 precursor [Labilithrix sp.]